MDIAALRTGFYILGTFVMNGMAETQFNMQSANFSNYHSNNNNPNPSNGSILEREGHDKDIEKVMLPMLLGLKLSGLATATFTILKIFVLQALMASKVALFGALLLAFKALYIYLRDKYWKTKIPKTESHPYPGFMFPHHWPQWDLPVGYYPDTNYVAEDHLSQASGANNVVYSYDPYAAHHNDSFAVKADRVKLTTMPPNTANMPYIARITETTYD